jgi:hypothetical protein
LISPPETYFRFAAFLFLVAGFLTAAFLPTAFFAGAFFVEPLLGAAAFFRDLFGLRIAAR